MGLPNVFIIGVQKAGTTTLHDWLIQHPGIFGKKELKDEDFFTNPRRCDNAKKLLESEFKGSRSEKIILHSCVNYFVYRQSLCRIRFLASGLGENYHFLAKSY